MYELGEQRFMWIGNNDERMSRMTQLPPLIVQSEKSSKVTMSVDGL